jgi:hypothetical protein
MPIKILYYYSSHSPLTALVSSLLSLVFTKSFIMKILYYYSLYLKYIVMPIVLFSVGVYIIAGIFVGCRYLIWGNQNRNIKPKNNTQQDSRKKKDWLNLMTLRSKMQSTLRKTLKLKKDEEEKMEFGGYTLVSSGNKYVRNLDKPKKRFPGLRILNEYMHDGRTLLRGLVAANMHETTIDGYRKYHVVDMLGKFRDIPPEVEVEGELRTRKKLYHGTSVKNVLNMLVEDPKVGRVNVYGEAFCTVNDFASAEVYAKRTPGQEAIIEMDYKYPEIQDATLSKDIKDCGDTLFLGRALHVPKILQKESENSLKIRAVYLKN